MHLSSNGHIIYRSNESHFWYRFCSSDIFSFEVKTISPGAELVFLIVCYCLRSLANEIISCNYKGDWNKLTFLTHI